MGHTLNSIGFEITPYLSGDKQYLYFASNGHGGYGDSDIYVSKRVGDGWFNWSKPQNLGKQINSKGFDAGLMIANDSTAFFTSNRNGGLADLFETKLLSEPDTLKKAEVPIVFQELSKEEIEELQPTEQDNSMADLSDSRKEAIVVEDVYPLTISIYFAFDSYELSGEAQEKMRELFEKYTQGEVQVELTGHTDAIGSPQYNQKLSENRALSAEKFLAQAGLAERRMQAKGKGEAEPIASNETPQGRQRNRRVTIKVVK
jgi:outer membrane protein OmpA-like peptidoglycan-associated protein